MFRRIRVLVVCSAILTLFLLAPASAQFSTDFEDDIYEASAEGTSVTGQDEFYLPASAGSVEWNCYTYEDNDFDFPDNPDGGDQFVAGRGPGPDGTGLVEFARAQRDVEYGPGIWTCTFDIAVSFDGTLPTAQNIGSFSTQEFAPPAGDSTFIALARWDDVSLATEWNADFIYFDLLGIQVTAQVPDENFQGLAVDTWYRWAVTFDLDMNSITEISIEDIDSGDSFTYEPVDWYLVGGPTGGMPEPTGFRLFAGSGTVEGNIIAIDNISIIQDCDGNGVDDAEDLDSGEAEDCNDNGRIDTCEGGLIASQVLADDPQAADDFGHALGVSGNTIVVGAPLNDDNGGSSGVAHFFENDDGTWTEIDVLTSEDVEIGDQFGSALALSGDVCVFGVYRDDDEGTSTGSAYVFRRDSRGEWSQEQKLSASDAAASQQFGWSVATDESRIIVGARATTGAGPTSGSAYIFDYDAAEGEWVESQTIVASDEAGGDQFGRSVAIDGDICAIGASQNDDAGSSSGSAYVFRYDPDSDEWTEEQKLTASDAASGDNFGRSIAMSGEVVVVGSPLDDTVADNGGAAYVFRHDGTEWVEEIELVSSQPETDAEFGDSVAISGALAIVGAHEDDATQGAAYLFQYDDSEWVELGKVNGADPEAGDEFGLGVAVADGLIVAGSPGDGDDTVEGGAFYTVFKADCNDNGVPDSCEIDAGDVADDNSNGVPDSCESPSDRVEFKRGDADNNGSFSALLDALYMLRFAFQQGDDIECFDAADANDSGGFSALLDGLFALNFAFNSGDPFPDPGELTCGEDPTDDALDCATPSDECA